MFVRGVPQLAVLPHWSKPRFNWAATSWPDSNDLIRLKGKLNKFPRDRSNERSMPPKWLVSENEVVRFKNELQPPTPTCKPKSKHELNRSDKIGRPLKSAMVLVFL